MRLTYTIKADLKNTLYVAKEINSITGMQPECIETDNGVKLHYNTAEALKVESGTISVDDYIVRNKIIIK